VLLEITRHAGGIRVDLGFGCRQQSQLFQPIGGLAAIISAAFAILAEMIVMATKIEINCADNSTICIGL
jgi:hypothetical protein